MSRHPTNSELKECLRVFTEKANDTIAKLTDQVDVMSKENTLLQNRLAYYENPNSLHAHLNIKEKRKARENGESPPPKKSGGSLGHKGTSRKHNPSRTVTHTMKNTKCSCGGTMKYSHTKTRDIMTSSCRRD
ncbi:MAG: hypothetical protein K8823_698 [Cenarchaeum symbiont of Oopsacas minuta]|nr:hypothetical protein [Cenarchaeum symbiont of Oopsacas minuta]